MRMRRIFADLHIHIGRTTAGEAVKITGARNLTFANIAAEASGRKGIDMIGIIDAASPGVQEDIARLIAQGAVQELAGGGLQYEQTTIILGCELEIKPDGCGAAHLLCYFPHFEDMRAFSAFLSSHMKNTRLSTQRFHGELPALFEHVEQLGGIIIPAHIFTPFKSLYGSSTDRMTSVLPKERIAAVELGLSADTVMADQIAELKEFTFLSNSDAHSLPKIGREYNELLVNSNDFRGWLEALERKAGARVVANYGLNPHLGKYYRTFCKQCQMPLEKSAAVCPKCRSRTVIRGVRDRINDIKRGDGKSPSHRPPYIYQIPLEFIPQVGPRTLEKLLDHFGTEMAILHKAKKEDLRAVVGDALAETIVQARQSALPIEAGGGGTYGRIKR